MNNELRADIRRIAECVRDRECWDYIAEECAERLLAWLDELDAQEPPAPQYMGHVRSTPASTTADAPLPKYDGVRVEAVDIDDDDGDMCWSDDDAQLAAVRAENAEYLKWVGGK